MLNVQDVICSIITVQDKHFRNFLRYVRLTNRHDAYLPIAELLPSFTRSLPL